MKLSEVFCFKAVAPAVAALAATFTSGCADPGGRPNPAGYAATGAILGGLGGLVIGQSQQNSYDSQYYNYNRAPRYNNNYYQNNNGYYNNYNNRGYGYGQRRHHGGYGYYRLTEDSVATDIEEKEFMKQYEDLLKKNLDAPKLVPVF